MESSRSPRATERTALRYHDGRWSRIRDRVTQERPLHIVINGKELISLLCSPSQREELAVGFLLSEGFLHSPEQIRTLALDRSEDRVRLELIGPTIDLEERIRNITLTSGCGRGVLLCDTLDAVTAVEDTASLCLSPERILQGMSHLHRRSSSYLATGGTHSAAVTDGEKILAFAEDIGRHNAVDKVLGHCFLNRIETGDKAVLATGRISSEIIMKVGRSRVPILATRAAATDQVIRIAETLGITLIGFARGRRMNIYTCPERIIGGGEDHP